MARLFERKAPKVVSDLMDDFGLQPEQASAIVGNLGHESGGFELMQEQRPAVQGSAGGYGWAQWTGPRRRAYFKWCDKAKLDPASDEANYGYLKVELKGEYANAIAALKRKANLRDMVIAFERLYEGAGVKSYDSRLKYAQRALAAYRASIPATPPDVEPVEDDEEQPEKKGISLGTKTISTAAVTGVATSVFGSLDNWQVAAVIAGLGFAIFLVIWFTHGRGK